MCKYNPSHPQHGRIALHRTSHSGQTALVRSLLDHGVDVHEVDEVGRCGVLLDGRARDVHDVLYMLDTCICVSSDGSLF